MKSIEIQLVPIYRFIPMREIVIGTLVRRIVKQRGIKADDLALILKVSRPNVFSIYRRKSIDTELLERLCRALEYNFFEHYSQRFSQFDPKESDHKVLDSEINYIKQALRDKDEMYSMAKRQIQLLTEINQFKGPTNRPVNLSAPQGADSQKKKLHRNK